MTLSSGAVLPWVDEALGLHGRVGTLGVRNCGFQGFFSLRRDALTL